jgi:glycerol-3-phosphate dehydrogenase
MSEAVARHGRDIGEQSVRHLVFNYGSAYGEVLKYLDGLPGMGERLSDRTRVLKAEVLHAVREEMAEKFSDVVFRRTELGVLGDPGEVALSVCAAIMADELGWDEVRVEQELQEVHAMFSAGVLGGRQVETPA